MDDTQRPTLVLKTGAGEIDLLNPRAKDVNIDDMLHNLSRIPRWCGAGKLSVLQHMMVVSQLLHGVGESRVTVLAGLTHDLHEYATGDIPAPLLTGLMYDDGVALHRVTDMQRHIQVAIQARLGIDLTGADMDAVQRADEMARVQEQELDSDWSAWRIFDISKLSPDDCIARYRRGLQQLGVEV